MRPRYAVVHDDLGLVAGADVLGSVASVADGSCAHAVAAARAAADRLVDQHSPGPHAHASADHATALGHGCVAGGVGAVAHDRESQALGGQEATFGHELLTNAGQTHRREPLQDVLFLVDYHLGGALHQVHPDTDSGLRQGLHFEVQPLLLVGDLAGQFLLLVGQDAGVLKIDLLLFGLGVGGSSEGVRTGEA